MRLLDYTEAQHFGRPLPAYQQGIAQSLAALHRNSSSRLLQEGSLVFEAHRISLLNNIERWMLFGVSQYRRSLGMFTPSNAAWSQVSLYYSCFYAANAILGMYGVWIGLSHWADVEVGTPFQQVIQIHKRRAKGPSGYGGSHQNFWDLYYEGCASFAAWVPSGLSDAITPVNNDRVWQINSRNQVNYDMAHAFDASLDTRTCGRGGMHFHFGANHRGPIRESGLAGVKGIAGVLAGDHSIEARQISLEPSAPHPSFGH